MHRRNLICATAALCAGCGGASVGDGSLGSPGSTSAATLAPVAPAPAGASVPVNASYRLTLRSFWTAEMFPTQFPNGAHLTGIVGATHGAGVSFWSPGALATVGIKDVAERGSKSALLDEVTRAISTGTASAPLSGAGVPLGASDVSLEFTLSQTMPRVTLVTMLGPSPDWFTGVGGVPLFVDGAWQDRLEIPLRAYDSGTDSGLTFNSADAVTQPPEVVTALTTNSADGDFVEGLSRQAAQPIASISFVRLS